MNVENLAEICHEVNKAYCEALGDMSQESWADAPDWQKQSAVNGVRFHLDNPEASASHSHENWLQEKIDAGWIYGEEKNAELKTHPCVVPFHELPISQQAKDYIFKAIVRSCAKHITA